MNPAFQGESKPFRCVECGVDLPMVIRSTPQSQTVVCAFCGARYHGVVWASVPENLKGNIRIVKD